MTVTLASRLESGATERVATDSAETPTIWNRRFSTFALESVSRIRDDVPSGARDSRPR